MSGEAGVDGDGQTDYAGMFCFCAVFVGLVAQSTVSQSLSE